ncbi:MAG TPA: membrane protein insertase YidC [Candidatus Limnocylindria bacterium]|nr:membrane protein insertase YidC [Candidatus Limnocylindria bacterium]
MDRKGIAILVTTFALLLAWMVVVKKVIAPDKPPVPGATNLVVHASTNLSATSNAAVTLPTPATAVALSNQPPVLSATAPEQTLTLENDKIRAVFTSHGGGLKYVELKDYPAHVTKKKDGLAPELASLNKHAFLPAFTHANSPALMGDGEFTITKTPTGVQAVKNLAGGIRVVKDFAVSTNYILNASVRIENTGSQPVLLPEQELVIGTGAPMDPYETGDQQGAFWFNGESAAHLGLGQFVQGGVFGMGGTPISQVEVGSSNVVWAAIHNRFFALVAVPSAPAEKAIVRDFALPAPSREQLAADGKLNPKPKAYQAALIYPAETLAAGHTLEQKFNVYAGPKEYFTLSQLDPQLDLVMDFSGFKGFFAKALLLSLNAIHHFIPSYGWSIIAITVIIKALFWPLTAASTRSMKRMQAIQPQLKALKDKYKDNPTKLNEQTLRVMKENKVNPAAGCLPMLIQMPVFIGFFFMLRTAIELRGASFLWVSDLSQPDTLFVIPGLGFLPFLGINGVGLPINLLPIIMGCTSLYLASLTPPSPQMDPAQQKMMKYMPVFFTLFLYNYSSGLTLYWTVQNLITVLQNKLTKMNDDKGTATPVTPVRLNGGKRA